MDLEQTLGVEELLQSQNRKLAADSLALAEQAFSIGLGATTTPALIVLVVVFILSRNFILTAMVLLLEVLLALGWASFAANRTNEKNAERIYRQTIRPVLEEWAAANHSSLDDLRRAAEEHLPLEAPLRRLLAQEALPKDEVP